MQTLHGNNINQALDEWIKELEKYNLTQLLAKPSPVAWSMGQLYIHLIESTHFFIKQARICSSGNDNINGERFPEAEPMFLNNEFPDKLLEGPPSNAVTPQPTSKEQILAELISLKEKIIKAEYMTAKSQFKGKTKHFGLGYFTAKEWLQFAEMHCRHHLRQKKRLDDFLKIR